jgi:hypothetical protein
VDVVIELKNGRQVVVRATMDEVERSVQTALRFTTSLRIDTPTGPVHINPRQIVSFAHEASAVLC